MIQATVVIPTKDRWDRLGETLDSALAQEGVSLEVIVVDDGSREEIPAALAGKGEGRVRVIRHHPSRGVAAARNVAIADARGEWLAFLDDDDLWAPEKLRTQLAASMQAGASWAYAAALVVDERHSPIDIIDAPPPERLIESLLAYNPIPAGASNVMARTAVVRELGGYDETFSQLADWDLWIRLADAGPAVACTEPLMAYVQHGGSMVLSDRPGLVREFDRLAAKHAALATRHGVAFDRAGLLAWMAWADSRAGRRWPAALGYLRAGLVYARRRVGWAARQNLRHAAGALRGRVLTDTGRDRAQQAPREPPRWLERTR